MKFQFLPLARTELRDAAHWYEAAAEGLGCGCLKVCRERVTI